ncbi:MAG: hypothetical protein M3N97_05290 [Pseudomonadota bacterium]|nr:hypothetical protein [Pseudomonadota bacterium]
MSANQGSSDESIGRPEQWREGRYEQPGKEQPGKPDPSVKRSPRTDEVPPDRVSTPVTEEDYEKLEPPPVIKR